MSWVYELDMLIYSLSLYPVIFLSVLFYLLVFSNLLISPKRKRNNLKNDGFYPFVTIQIPVYNDPIVRRCIESCLRLDYPKDRYEIVVADDSDHEETRRIVDSFKGKVKVVRRRERKGFKAGALNNALKHSKGEIIVIFDADFRVPRSLLKRIVLPFKDKRVAAVQGKQKFMNVHQNYVSKFAGILQYIYYNVWVPLQDFLGITFCGGTVLAIRKDVLLKLGKWNEKSLTEDADLTIKILKNGDKILYLEEVHATGEVPYRLRHFLRQQARWAYGLTRVFIENAKDILFNRRFTFMQKLLLSFTTLGHGFAPIIVIMFVTGQLGWFLGTPKPFEFGDFVRFMKVMMLTSGFLALSVYALRKEKLLHLVPDALILAFTLGIVNAANSSVAFFKALLGTKEGWRRTPKFGNLLVLRRFFGIKHFE